MSRHRFTTPHAPRPPLTATRRRWIHGEIQPMAPMRPPLAARIRRIEERYCLTTRLAYGIAGIIAGLFLYQALRAWL